MAEPLADPTLREAMTLGTMATTAALLEASAMKVGNVHPGASFADMHYLDFVLSAMAIGPVFQQADTLSIGELVLKGVEATRRVTSVNTNLGTLLLFAPLSKALVLRSSGPILCTSFQSNIDQILGRLSPKDSQLVYRAIVLANPGGLGKVDQMDVSQSEAPESLIEAMRAASDRDLVAAEYIQAFKVCRQIEEQLTDLRNQGLTWNDAICRVQLHLLSELGDTLIRRKCSASIEREVMRLARRALDAENREDPRTTIYRNELDHYLRSEGHRRNPGTTADLIAGGLLLCLARMQDRSTKDGHLFLHSS